MDDREKRDAEEGGRAALLGNADTLRKQHKEKRPGSHRRTALLALVLTVGLAGLFAVGSRIVVPKEPEPSPPAASLLIDSVRSVVQELTVTLPSDGYTIISENGVYRLKGEPGFAVDQAKARDLLDASTYIFYESVLKAPESLSAYGLEKPSATVTVLGADGSARTFLLGDRTPSGNRYYLMEQGDPSVYIVYASTGKGLLLERRDLHAASLPSIAVNSIQKVSLSFADGETVTVGFEADTETVGVSALWLTEPIRYEADAEKVSSYFESIAAIQLKGFEAEATPDTLAMYGLETPKMRLVVFGADEKGNPVAIRELAIGGDKDESSIYAYIDGTSDVYLLNRSSVSFLSSVTTARLVDRFANIISLAKVDSLDVLADGLRASFRIDRTPELDSESHPKSNRNGQPVVSEQFSLNGKPIEDAAFRRLYQLVIGTLVDGMIPEDRMPGQDAAPVLTVRYRLNTVREEELVEYLPYDADHYAVRRNGVCIFYILKTRVDVIPQALAEFVAGM